jgi:hypothetical protein
VNGRVDLPLNGLFIYFIFVHVHPSYSFLWVQAPHFGDGGAWISLYCLSSFHILKIRGNLTLKPETLDGPDSALPF